MLSHLEAGELPWCIVMLGTGLFMHVPLVVPGWLVLPRHFPEKQKGERLESDVPPGQRARADNLPSLPSLSSAMWCFSDCRQTEQCSPSLPLLKQLLSEFAISVGKLG